MDLNPDRLRQMSKREILRDLIEHVSTSEEEHEEKEHRSGSSTDLNHIHSFVVGIRGDSMNRSIAKCVNASKE